MVNWPKVKGSLVPGGQANANRAHETRALVCRLVGFTVGRKKRKGSVQCSWGGGPTQGPRVLVW